MSFSYIANSAGSAGGSSGSDNSNTTFNPGATIPIGSLVVVAGVSGQNISSPFSDNTNANTYNYLYNSVAFADGTFWYSLAWFVAVDAITTSNIFKMFYGLEGVFCMSAFSGQAASSIFDIKSATENTTATITPTNDGALIIGVNVLQYASSGAGFEAVTGWTSPGAVYAASDCAVGMDYVINGSGSDAVSPTFAAVPPWNKTSTQYYNLLATFNPAATAIIANPVVTTLKAPKQTFDATEVLPDHIVTTLKPPTQTMHVTEVVGVAQIVTTLKAPKQTIDVTEVLPDHVVTTLKSIMQTVDVVEVEPCAIATTLKGFGQASQVVVADEVIPTAIATNLPGFRPGAMDMQVQTFELEPSTIITTLPGFAPGAMDMVVNVTEIIPIHIVTTLPTLSQVLEARMVVPLSGSSFYSYWGNRAAT